MKRCMATRITPEKEDRSKWRLFMVGKSEKKIKPQTRIGAQKQRELCKEKTIAEPNNRGRKAKLCFLFCDLGPLFFSSFFCCPLLYANKQAYSKNGDQVLHNIQENKPCDKEHRKHKGLRARNLIALKRPCHGCCAKSKLSASFAGECRTLLQGQGYPAEIFFCVLLQLLRSLFRVHLKPFLPKPSLPIFLCPIFFT